MLKQLDLQNKVDGLLTSVRGNKMLPSVFEDSLALLLKNYKNDVKINYIYAAPNTAAAYFALFQKLNGSVACFESRAASDSGRDTDIFQCIEVRKKMIGLKNKAYFEIAYIGEFTV